MSKHIYLKDVDFFLLLANKIDETILDKSIFNMLISEIGRQIFRFATYKHINNLFNLGLGSLRFLNDQHKMLQNKRYMIIVSSNKIYCKLPTSPFNCECITHKQFGGATTYSTIYATSESNLPCNFISSLDVIIVQCKLSGFFQIYFNTSTSL